MYRGPARGLTGYEYLRFYGRLYGLSRTAAGRAADRLLGDFGLAERASSRIVPGGTEVGFGQHGATR